MEVIGNIFKPGIKVSIIVDNKPVIIFIVPFLPDKSKIHEIMPVGKKTKNGATGTANISKASLTSAKNIAM
ncbi:MAG TPA: hypothetical protein P5052_03530 [Candidatus Paceibacterota bacterium]|jgi:hypothetical protein|nr:hypothetical protein [Candidatus Paceibacterota bacterium]